MKDGYEARNGDWCTITGFSWRSASGYKEKSQIAVAVDDAASNENLYINIKRSNLENMDKADLLRMFEEKAEMYEEQDEQQDGLQWRQLLKKFQELKSADDENEDVLSED